MLPASFSYLSGSVNFEWAMYPPQRGLPPARSSLGFRFERKIKNQVSRWAEASKKCFRCAPSHIFNILKIVLDGEIQIQRCAIAQAQPESDSIPALSL
jgi:hypothetical protein